ncbi:hypothetical protein LDENG_00236520 [Lucifuga dentata]|nr:hypothetical protein LDENG_00236520 [Lucifuga dentata]
MVILFLHNSFNLDQVSDLSPPNPPTALLTPHVLHAEQHMIRLCSTLILNDVGEGRQQE